MLNRNLTAARPEPPSPPRRPRPIVRRLTRACLPKGSLGLLGVTLLALSTSVSAEPLLLAAANPAPSEPSLTADLDLSKSSRPRTGVKLSTRPKPATEAELQFVSALISLPPPYYEAPVALAALGWARGFGAVRLEQDVRPPVALAPRDHAGQSLSLSPRLWWRLEDASTQPIQITVVDDESVDPVLRIELVGPHDAGVDNIDLSVYGVELEPGQTYRWFVSLIVDPKRPSRNPSTMGLVEVVGDADDRRARIAGAPETLRGHEMAKLGVWYDAYDFFADLARVYPEEGALVVHRDELTSSLVLSSNDQIAVRTNSAAP